MSHHGEKFRAFVEGRGMNKTKLAGDLGMTKQNLYQLFKSKVLQPETIKKIERHMKVTWADIDTVNIDAPRETVEEPEADYSQPIIQVVLNLSYAGKKNADSMEKMAATNQRNTEIIAALVGAVLPNSKLAEQLTASLGDLHKVSDDLPAEAFYPQRGTGPAPDKERVGGKGFAKGK